MASRSAAAAGHQASKEGSSFLPESAQLKPTMDYIFAEVQDSLPNIDFEVSDVSSDDDVPIFQRVLKTPDLDDSEPIYDDEEEVGEENSEFRESHSTFRVDLKSASYTTPHGEQSTESGISLSENVMGTMMQELGMPHDWSSGIGALARGLDSQSTGYSSTSLGVPSLRRSSQGAEDTGTGPAPPMRNTWVGTNATDRIDVDIPSPTISPRMEKRREVPELSPNSEDGSKGRDSEVTGMMKRPKEKRNAKLESCAIVSKFMPPEVPTLDSSHIDQLLSGTVSSVEIPTFAMGGEESTQQEGQGDAAISLIQKLANLSMTQSGTHLKDVDPETGALRMRKIPLKDVKTARNVSVSASQKGAQKTTAKGTTTADLANLPTSSLSPAQTRRDLGEERETVYLDLRGHDKNRAQEQQNIEAVQRILRITQTTEQDSSSSDAEDDVELWHEQRRRVKDSLRSTGAVPRDWERGTVKRQASAKVSPRPATQAQRLAGHLRMTSSTKQDAIPATKRGDSSGTSVETCEAPSTADREVVGRPPRPEDVVDKEKQRRLEAAKKLREKRESERQSRIRLGKRLEALRPTASDRARQPVAEATPTLFDIESSYEPALHTLPPCMPPGRECLLLTVHLSSNGEIVAHRSSSNRSVDSGVGLSASYTTLLTWLLSLVPQDFSFLESPASSTSTSSSSSPSTPSAAAAAAAVPFHVLGLQQMHLDGQLRLYIAVTTADNHTPSRESPGKARQKTKKRVEMKDSTHFQQVLTKFLSGNTLHSVCPWLQDLVSMEVSPESVGKRPDPEQRGAGAVPFFVYRPPLPNTTTRPLSTFIQLSPNVDAACRVFGTPVGFFWQTVENDESCFQHGCTDDSGEGGGSSSADGETQATMSLVYKKVYRDPRATMGILNRVLQDGLDLAGVRLLYPTADHVGNGGAASSAIQALNGGTNESSTDAATLGQMGMLNKIGPILAFAVRGAFARSFWLDAIGPSDPQLARRTDPNSLCALYGGDSRDECLLFCPRNPSRVLSELCRWFGGRVPASGVIDVGSSSRRDRQSSPSAETERERERRAAGKKQCRGSGGGESNIKATEIPTSKPPATLTASARSEVFIAVSPLVPPKCLGLLLAICQRRGYHLRGVRRTHLSGKRATTLGLSGQSLQAFTLGSSSSSASGPDHHQGFLGDAPSGAGFHRMSDPLRPSTLLLLNKENAMHSCASLVEAFMVQMSLQDVLGPIQAELDASLTSAFLFHIAPYTDGLCSALGGDLSKVPEAELATTPGYIAPKLYTNPEVEQIVVLTLTGRERMTTCGLFLGRLLNLVPYTKKAACLPLPGDGFELLGIKWLPSLAMQHAKELTPYEVGDRGWKTSIHTLTSEPAVALVLRAIGAYKRIEDLLATCKPPSLHPGTLQPLDRLLSPTPEIAYRQVTLFFHDRELFADPGARTLLEYLPPNRGTISPEQAVVEASSRVKRRCRQEPTSVESGPRESVLRTMLSGALLLTTLLVVKPGVVHKHLGKLMKRVVQEGFHVVALRLATLSDEQAQAIVPQEDKQSEVLVGMHKDYLTGQPSLVLCLQRENAVKRLLDLLGPEDPKAAKQRNMFLWRATFGSDPIANGLHGSRDYYSAMQELRLFFPAGLCCKPTEDLEAEQVDCPAVDVIADLKKFRRREVIFSALSSTSSLTSSTTSFTTSRATSSATCQTLSSGTSTDVPWTSFSMLTQTNCVVLTPLLLQQAPRSRRPPYVHILEGLLNQGFDVVGARMLWFTEEQAQHYLHLYDAGSFAMVPLLRSGPSLVLALQRDNGVMAFNSLLGEGSFNSESLFSKYGSKILRSKDVRMACQHLAYFFSELVPGSHASIVDKEP